MLRLQAEALWPIEKKVFENYKFPKGGKILDVACGSGEMSIRLAILFPESHILGLDLVN